MFYGIAILFKVVKEMNDVKSKWSEIRTKKYFSIKFAYLL